MIDMWRLFGSFGLFGGFLSEGRKGAFFLPILMRRRRREQAVRHVSRRNG